MDEYASYVLARSLRAVVKVNYLKSCLGGEAYELVKSYTHGNQLNDAVEALEQNYNTADFIVSEVDWKFKYLPLCTSFKNVKT